MDSIDLPVESREGGEAGPIYGPPRLKWKLQGERLLSLHLMTAEFSDPARNPAGWRAELRAEFSPSRGRSTQSPRGDVQLTVVRVAAGIY